jgi:predicted XRE-type DNA-binding protein
MNCLRWYKLLNNKGIGFDYPFLLRFSIQLLENRQKATIDGLIVKGSDRKNAKLTEELVICIHLMNKVNRFTHQQIAGFFAVSRSLVSRGVSGKI